MVFSQSSSLVQKQLPELEHLERVLKSLQNKAGIEVLTYVKYDNIDFPIYGIVLGTTDRTAPTLAISGGVHGLERIGSEVAIAYLHTLSEALEWDRSLAERLEKSRMVFLPMINPVGMFLTRRSNGNNVDLMRNAPVVAEENPPFLLGGQKFSRRLPWFQGNVLKTEDMEIETQTVYKFYQKELLSSKLALSIDIHSGFGIRDQLWFPYAKSKRPPPHVAEIHALKNLFDRTYPNHIYKIEPQAYTTHGDLWDYLYDESQATNDLSQKLYIPWTLELGSWLWLKKNPRQVFSALGPFNPGKPHRLQRILRRHLTLFDFMHRAILSPDAWTKLEDAVRKDLTSHAMDLWYAA